jgi:rare lipoprotein A (peptidoglycan hydrolase)
MEGEQRAGGFDKNKYTAAHKNCLLAQELKSLMKPTEVYNCRNYRSWTFVKSREIDLSKKSFYGYRKQ